MKTELYGLITDIEINDGEKEAIELLQEVIREQLPDTVKELSDLIVKMGYEDKALLYLDYKQVQYDEQDDDEETHSYADDIRFDFNEGITK